jgi:hypothetical protein
MIIKRQQTEDVIHAYLYNRTGLEAEKLSNGFETYNKGTKRGMKKMWS